LPPPSPIDDKVKDGKKIFVSTKPEVGIQQRARLKDVVYRAFSQTAVRSSRLAAL